MTPSLSRHLRANRVSVRAIASSFLTGTVALAFMMTSAGCATGPVKQYDLVVYGGTAGGAVAAVAAANEGMSVVLLEPRDHIGGMVSGGLGRTDHGRKEVVGGMSRAFFERVGGHYGEPITWYFEPHVAEQVFRAWLDEAGVEVRQRQQLTNVHKLGRTIQRIKMADGTAYAAEVFIDATYEGDLMAGAGVSYTVGREGQDVYGESLAGRIAHSPKHQFDVAVSPYDDDGELLPCVYGGDPGEPGEGDQKVQAYNFRICMCSRKENQVPFPKPADYDPYRYELLKRYLAKRGDEIKLTNIIHIGHMPNDKTDVNNNGAFSTDHIGGSWDYPEASPEQREVIWNDHVSYVQGFFYFLANDPSVPKHIQDEMNTWGLAKDEFTDTGHWPHQLYIREARRMIGAYVMTQADLQTDRTKPDSIGMGSYNSDSHHVQRIPTVDGAVVNEGDMQVPVQPYEIAYRALTPKAEQCGNLLVPMCPSASHVAFSSIRMEPVYMIMGQASGVAAAMAIRSETPVQAIDVEALRSRLRAQRAVLSLDDVAAPHVDARTLRGVVVDNDDAEIVGAWSASTSTGAFVGHHYLHDNNEGKGANRIRYPAPIRKPGLYEIRVSYSPHANRATNVPVTIHTMDGDKTVQINQRKPLADPPFVSLGTFKLWAGSKSWVEISTAGTDGHVIADAVQFVAKAAD